MDVLAYAFNAVMPLLLLIALGNFLKEKSKWSLKFFSDLNHFCYRILLPIQLFHNVYQIKEFSEINWNFLDGNSLRHNSRSPWACFLIKGVIYE